MARDFLFLLGSTRGGGNTEALARHAAEQLPAGDTARWLSLVDLELPPFRDIRHGEDPVPPAPTGDAARLLDATLAATDLVIASPLYWYSVSAPVKHYLDHWVTWLSRPELDFKQRMTGRTLWGVSVLAGADHSAADPLVDTLRRSATYLGMRWGGALLGTGTEPGDIEGDLDAVAQAKTFFSATPAPATPA
ncbi:flavodoxin family protein [Streptomyces sp. NBC_00083]|uniref:flavodoxin family protein n=1 Tax=Streptomyces sp. NBC_00083 TaxID=2975647 RepID=UPI00225A6A9B|nr:NAD(P)H-dependent oxidoreductase [Streptomyces sp. NBC_00083]MCX5384982.1 NAD(P)H-dependent oxidoreductase [Streptomyces sp. NBC_00083]